MMRKIVKLILILACLTAFFYINNSWLTVTKHTVESPKIPQEFDGFRIVQLSDLHDAKFGKNQKRLVDKISEAGPDMIVITGDVIDSNRYDLESSLELIDQITDLADIYYVTGNHEVATNDLDHIKEELKARDVHVLSDETVSITKGDSKIPLTGIEDPLLGADAEDMLAGSNLSSGKIFNMLLAHRPEDIQAYADAGIDLAFSGHAHGGQFRFPIIGGLVAPGQGYFPKYTAGVHEKEQLRLVISRGLGNSVIPIRIFNLPEIVIVTLKST